jgi:hypothetical protein
MWTNNANYLMYRMLRHEASGSMIVHSSWLPYVREMRDARLITVDLCTQVSATTHNVFYTITDLGRVMHKLNAREPI